MIKFKFLFIFFIGYSGLAFGMVNFDVEFICNTEKDIKHLKEINNYELLNNYVNTLKNKIKSDKTVNLLNDSGYSLLMWLSLCDHKELVKVLIKSKVNLNLQNHKRENALFCAVKNENIVIIKLLIEKKADLNLRINRLDETVLMYAARKGLSDIVKILVDAGANLYYKNIFGCDVFDYRVDNKIAAILSDTKKKNQDIVYNKLKEIKLSF